MKKLLVAAFLFSGYTTIAQELAYKIPGNALAVVSVKGDKLLDLLSAAEFNNSFVGKKILEEASEHKRNGDFRSIEDFGVRLNGTAYYFNQQTDSIAYHCLLLPLSDVQKFEALFKKKHLQQIVRNGDTRQLYNEGDKAMLQWNNEMAYFVFGDLKASYLEDDSARAARYGIKKVSYSDYYNSTTTAVAYTDDAVVDTAVSVDYPGEGVKDAAAAVAEEDPDYPVAETVAAPVEDMDVKEPEIVEAPPVVEAYEDKTMDAVVAAPPMDVSPYTTTAVAEPEDSYYDRNGYEAAYQEQRTIKKKLTADWVKAFAIAGFRKNDPSNSILENAAYLRSQDNNAAATLYLSNMQSLYNGILPYYSKEYFGGAMKGYGSVNAKLFLEKEQARITSEMQVDDEKAASYKRMYNHKPNKKFAKYINSDKMVAFMSYSFDTEAYLKELPRMLDQSYGRYFGLYSDEIGMGAELFSLLLDEKAVAKVIKGDAVLLLNDIGPKEYTYTTYEYDDDYKRTEVKKTKKETLPEFLFMMSSDDTHLLERVLQYGIRKEKITLKNGIYTLDNSITRGNPFSVHILIKDGIIFCGTSYRDIQQISTDNYQPNISGEQKNLLLKNNVSVFFNPKNVVGKISEKEFGNSRKLRDFNTLLGNTGKMYARTTGIKNNIISGEMVAEVPEGNVNALKYFFSLAELAAKLD